MQTANKKVTLAIADATSMDAYVVWPETSGTFPGIMLLQEAFGVTSHIRNVADRLASEGYVVIAPELFHRTAPGVEFDQNNIGAVMQHVTAMKVDEQEADLQATYNWLQEQSSVVKDKIGSIGFCMGGRVSFIANSLLPLSASISYYGSGIQGFSDRFKNIHGPMLFIWGGLDKHILPEHIGAVVTQMKENNKAFANIVFSYAGHAFNNDQRANYSADASKEAWALSLAFFKNKFA